MLSQGVEVCVVGLGKFASLKVRKGANPLCFLLSITDCFSQCNAGAGMVQAHMWCVVTLGEARHDCFSQCNAGADVVQRHMWVRRPQ